MPLSRPTALPRPAQRLQARSILQPVSCNDLESERQSPSSRNSDPRRGFGLYKWQPRRRVEEARQRWQQGCTADAVSAVQAVRGQIRGARFRGAVHRSGAREAAGMAFVSAGDDFFGI